MLVIASGLFVLVATFGPLFEKRGLRIAAEVIKAVVIALVVGQNVFGGYRSYRSAVLSPVRPPLYGLYQVENQSKNYQKSKRR